MRLLLFFIGKIIINFRGLNNRVLRTTLKCQFKNVGHNLKFSNKDIFSFKNISIGNDVYIGPGAIFLSSDAEIMIGNKVLFGPNVTIITGDHSTKLSGQYMADMKVKEWSC
jgi:acetyltransferase-like isoleucine patch superfamily enzyme